MGRHRVKVQMPEKMAEQVKNKKIVDLIRRSSEQEVKLTNPTEFFSKIMKPTESRLVSWIEELKKSTEEKLDTTGISRIIEYSEDGRWRWRIIKNSEDLKKSIEQAEKLQTYWMKEQTRAYSKMLKGREDVFGGSGFADDSVMTSTTGSVPSRGEYAPLIGSPFYKQMYLMDYWEMHSRCFWYSNYSGIAKMIVDITRNFVMGKGFTVTFDNPKAQKVWSEYEDRTMIQEAARDWCDELTKFGENMIKKIPGPIGISHQSFDPSTVWEIVTDPENIRNIKYYHQQYNTQYQIFATPDAPTSKYIINQIPPQLVLHTKVNVTSYEKRGRSDLLAPLLYFKYFEDYMTASLIRSKNEAAFIWDVTVKGSDEDVNAYISNSQSIADAPPGSENVHNESITRTPLSPQFGAGQQSEASANILSYVAMSTSVPMNYFGTHHTGGDTRAGALVATEPVAKKMVERQLKMEYMIRRIVKDVLVDANLDPNQPFEVTFPEIMEEDRSAKIKDLIVAQQEEVISHKTMAHMIAKELKVTKYDYDKEQEEIEERKSTQGLFDTEPGLTPGADSGDDEKRRAFDRSKVKKQGLSL